MKGSISLLMALGIIPVVMFLAIGSLSISRFYYRLEQQQKLNDSAALLAGSAYPDKTLAASKAKVYLETGSNLKITGLAVDFSDNTAQVTTNARYKMELINFFGLNVELPVVQRSSARLHSQSLALAIDTGHYLAPNPFSGELWEQAKFPAANFITDNFQDLELDKYGSSPAQLTQLCFNPVLYTLKKTALEITSYVRASGLNNFALAAFPGYANHFDEIYYQGAGNQPLIDSYEYGFNASAICAASAEREYSSTAYRFPVSQTSFGLEFYINQEDLSFQEEMLGQLGAEQQIWALSAKNIAYTYSIEHVFRFIVSALSATAGSFSSSKAVILAGDLPYFHDNRFPQAEASQALGTSLKLLEQLAEITAGEIKLYYLFISNKYQPVFTADEVAALESFIKSQLKEKSALQVQLFILDSDNSNSSKIYELLNEDEDAIIVS